MVAYLETRLADWIHSSGGWVRSFSIAALHIPLKSWSQGEDGGLWLELGAVVLGMRRKGPSVCIWVESGASLWAPLNSALQGCHAVIIQWAHGPKQRTGHTVAR